MLRREFLRGIAASLTIPSMNFSETEDKTYMIFKDYPEFFNLFTPLDYSDKDEAKIPLGNSNKMVIPSEAISGENIYEVRAKLNRNASTAVLACSKSRNLMLYDLKNIGSFTKTLYDGLTEKLEGLTNIFMRANKVPSNINFDKALALHCFPNNVWDYIEGRFTSMGGTLPPDRKNLVVGFAKQNDGSLNPLMHVITKHLYRTEENHLAIDSGMVIVGNQMFILGAF